MSDRAGYVIGRTLIILVGLIIAYYVVKKIIVPQILYPACLTDSTSCTSLSLWKYKNSFLAKVSSTDLYIFFDGEKLYLYNQTVGECANPQMWSTTVVISISYSGRTILYQREKDGCSPSLTRLEQFYSVNSELQNLYYRFIGQPTAIDIFENLVRDGYVAINN